MQAERCVVCFSPSVVDYPPSDNIHFSDKTHTWTLIDKELHVLFIFRNLFGVPRDKLKNYLIYGGNASVWGIGLCLRCHTQVESLKGIYHQLMDITKKFDDLRRELIQVAKNRINEGKASASSSDRLSVGEPNRILEDVRRFILDHNYADILPSINPFIEGDLLAKRLSIKSEEDFAAMCYYHDNDNDDYDQDDRGIDDYHQDDRGIDDYPTSPLTTDTTTYKSSANFPPPDKSICRLCNGTYSSKQQLKFHTSALHTETLFEGQQLPGVPDKLFKQLCQEVIKFDISHDDTSKRLSTPTMSCLHCGVGFKDRRYLQDHCLKMHYHKMAERLKIRQQSKLGKINTVTNLHNTFPEKSRDFSPVQRQTRPPPSPPPPPPKFKSNACTVKVKVSPAPARAHVPPPRPDLHVPFQCSLCNKRWASAENLKEHEVIAHPEKYFPISEFNQRNLPLPKYKANLKVLFQQENIQLEINGCYSCPTCPLRYLSKEAVVVHIVEAHFDYLSAKLREIMNPPSEISGLSTSTSSSAS